MGERKRVGEENRESRRGKVIGVEQRRVERQTDKESKKRSEREGKGETDRDRETVRAENHLS